MRVLVAFGVVILIVAVTASTIRRRRARERRRADAVMVPRAPSATTWGQAASSPSSSQGFRCGSVDFLGRVEHSLNHVIDRRVLN